MEERYDEARNGGKEEEENDQQSTKRIRSHDLRFSDKIDEPAPIVNIPDLLLETDRRVQYADNVEVIKEVSNWKL